MAINIIKFIIMNLPKIILTVSNGPLRNGVWFKMSNGLGDETSHIHECEF